MSTEKPHRRLKVVGLFFLTSSLRSGGSICSGLTLQSFDRSRHLARLQRHWFDQTAMGELLDIDFAVAERDRLYPCLDRLLEAKQGLFELLRQCWQDLFGAQFDVLLYDLTSTYFKGQDKEIPQAERGYSRDHRPDCLQVVIGLVITPERFPLAYEVMDGNTSDRTTLRAFLTQIETRYGKVRRVWVMDRGIPTEEILAEMRSADPPICHIFAYLLAKSEGRGAKEMAIRRRRLARLSHKLRAMRRTSQSACTLTQGKDLCLNAVSFTNTDIGQGTPTGSGPLSRLTGYSISSASRIRAIAAPTIVRIVPGTNNRWQSPQGSSRSWIVRTEADAPERDSATGEAEGKCHAPD